MHVRVAQCPSSLFPSLHSEEDVGCCMWERTDFCLLSLSLSLFRSLSLSEIPTVTSQIEFSGMGNTEKWKEKQQGLFHVMD